MCGSCVPITVCLSPKLAVSIQFQIGWGQHRIAKDTLGMQFGLVSCLTLSVRQLCTIVTQLAPSRLDISRVDLRFQGIGFAPA